jgi:predicted TIM-barrel fold metal-dependent hydrolase
MTDCRLIDTHVHLWDPARLRYPWHRDVPALDRPFLLDEFRAASRGLYIEAFVFVECACDPAQREAGVVLIGGADGKPALYEFTQTHMVYLQYQS